jgi:hypothetical protein
MKQTPTVSQIMEDAIRQRLGQLEFELIRAQALFTVQAERINQLEEQLAAREASKAEGAASKPAAEEPEPETKPQTPSHKPNGHLGHFAASAQTE